MAYVKSGWLQRQSTILRRWKKNWFDLWSDGRLIFYDDQHRRDMEDQIHMKVDCINIRTGNSCRDLTPGRQGPGLPAADRVQGRQDHQPVCGRARRRPGVVYGLAGLQNERGGRPPQMALPDEVVASAPPPYSEVVPPPQMYDQGRYVVYGPPPPPGTQIVYAADGQAYTVTYPYQYQGSYPPREVNQVIVRERHHDNGADLALGVLAGAATGMALGSLFVF